MTHRPLAAGLLAAGGANTAAATWVPTPLITRSVGAVRVRGRSAQIPNLQSPRLVPRSPVTPRRGAKRRRHEGSAGGATVRYG